MIDSRLQGGNVRRPDPPPGWIRFRWPTKLASDGKTKLRACPGCHEAGVVWCGGGFTDPLAQILARGVADADERIHSALFGVEHVVAFDGGPFEPRLRAFESTYPLLNGAASRNATVDGVPLLLHWSRFGTGQCPSCGLAFWHDFGGGGDDWWHYHPPAPGDQAALF